MASGMSSGVLALAFTVMSVGVAAQQPLSRRVFKGRYGSSLEDHTRYGHEVSEYRAPYLQLGPSCQLAVPCVRPCNQRSECIHTHSHGHVVYAALPITR